MAETVEDVEGWLEAHDGDPRYQNLTEVIAINVSTASTGPTEKPKKLSEVRDSLDLVINFTDQISHVAMQLIMNICGLYRRL